MSKTARTLLLSTCSATKEKPFVLMARRRAPCKIELTPGQQVVPQNRQSSCPAVICTCSLLCRAYAGSLHIIQYVTLEIIRYVSWKSPNPCWSETALEKIQSPRETRKQPRSSMLLRFPSNWDKIKNAPPPEIREARQDEAGWTMFEVPRPFLLWRKAWKNVKNIHKTALMLQY